MRRLCLVLALALTCRALAHAQTITFLEPGTDATATTAFWTAVAGAATSATDQSVTGPRSLKLDTGAGPTGVTAYTPVGVVADAGARCSFRVRFNGSDPAAIGQLAFAVNTSDQNVAGIRFNTNRVLQLRPTGGTDVDGTTVLAVDQWYRIAFSYVITNTTTHSFKVYLNGAAEITATNSGTLTRTGSSKMLLTAGTALGANRIFWIEDFYCDTGVADLSDPGNVRITAKLPTTRTNTEYTQGASGAVNERPTSATNYVVAPTSVTTVTEGYAIEAKGSGDVGITPSILGYACWNLTKTSATAVDAVVKIICNNSSGADIGASLTTSDLIFFTAATTATYPVTSPVIGQSSAGVGEVPQVEDLGVIIAWIDGGRRRRVRGARE